MNFHFVCEDYRLLNQCFSIILYGEMNKEINVDQEHKNTWPKLFERRITYQTDESLSSR